MLEEKNSSGLQWRKLDNAAKVFPATATRRNTKVFRFYCELHEEIEQENLQLALEITLEKFPLFKSVLRRGLFWFYLEHNEYIPVVKEEKKEPCSALYEEDDNKYLFRVNYYKNRINFEVFHVLTDGTGATYFLKELVKNYLYISYRNTGLEDVEILDEEWTHIDQEKDGFQKYYSEDVDKIDKKKINAHQIRGIKTEYETLQVIEGVVDTKTILGKAKEYGVSLTVYLTAAFIYAIHEEMNVKQERKPVVMMIPVNLRNYFPTESMMNFFGYIEPKYQFTQEKTHTFEDVIQEVKTYFEEELTEENMAKRMNYYTRLERHPLLRLTPLQMKNIGIQAGFSSTARDITAIFSNMSVVKMPESYEPYIKQFGVFTSTHKLELCMCSFQDRMVFNFTTYLDNVNIQRNFFRQLRKNDIEVEFTKEQFPEIDEENKKKVQFQQCLNFISIALIILAIVSNVIFMPDTMWYIFGIGMVASMWVSVSMGFRKRKNLLKNGLMQLFIISLGAVLWDLASGYRGWSVNYIIPLLVMLLLVFMIIMANVQNLNPEDYIMYLVITSVYGLLLPGLLMLLGVITAPAYAAVAMGFCALVLSFLGIFRKRALFIELQKNFHI